MGATWQTTSRFPIEMSNNEDLPLVIGDSCCDDFGKALKNAGVSYELVYRPGWTSDQILSMVKRYVAKKNGDGAKRRRPVILSLSANDEDSLHGATPTNIVQCARELCKLYLGPVHIVIPARAEDASNNLQKRFRSLEAAVAQVPNVFNNVANGEPLDRCLRIHYTAEMVQPTTKERMVSAKVRDCFHPHADDLQRIGEYLSRECVPLPQEQSKPIVPPVARKQNPIARKPIAPVAPVAIPRPCTAFMRNVMLEARAQSCADAFEFVEESLRKKNATRWVLRHVVGSSATALRILYNFKPALNDWGIEQIRAHKVVIVFEERVVKGVAAYDAYVDLFDGSGRKIRYRSGQELKKAGVVGGAPSLGVEVEKAHGHVGKVGVQREDALFAAIVKTDAPTHKLVGVVDCKGGEEHRARQ